MLVTFGIFMLLLVSIGIVVYWCCWCYNIILVLLYHCRSLCPQSADGLEDIDDALVLHSLQHNRQGDEDAGPADARTAR